MAYLIEVAWDPAAVAIALVDGNLVANGELVACERRFELTWTMPDGDAGGDIGRLNRGVPPTITYEGGAVVSAVAHPPVPAPGPPPVPFRPPLAGTPPWSARPRRPEPRQSRPPHLLRCLPVPVPRPSRPCRHPCLPPAGAVPPAGGAAPVAAGAAPAAAAVPVGGAVGGGAAVPASPPIRVYLVAGVRTAPHSRYRRRVTEIGRWQPAPANPSPERWMIHPGAMTGDLWHLVAALHFDPKLRLLVVWNRANEKDDLQANALLDLVDRLGLGVGDRVLRHSVNMGPGASVGNRDARVLGAERVADAISGHRRGIPLVGHTWASTSVLTQAALRGGYRPNRVPDALRDLFTEATAASTDFARYRAAFDAYCLGWLRRLQPGTHYILVNMRWTGEHGQNPQHNITQPRFNQIVDLAQWLTNMAGKPTEVIRVGRPELLDRENCGWLAGPGARDTAAVDIYCDDRANAPTGLHQQILTNKLYQPYFWRQVVASGRRASLIGGRSGGMDIASFLGVRTASWDRPSATDQHYLRLHWAAPVTSIIRAEDELLDQGALEYWMIDGDLIPLIDGDPVTGTVVGDITQYRDRNGFFEALWFPPY